MEKIKIELSLAEAKLLVHYLKEHASHREDDGCNDLLPDEVKSIGLTKEEWVPLLKDIGENSIENDNEKFEKVTDMFAPEPIWYIFNKINGMLPKSMRKKA